MTRQYQAGVYHCGILLIQGAFLKTHDGLVDPAAGNFDMSTLNSRGPFQDP